MQDLEGRTAVITGGGGGIGRGMAIAFAQAGMNVVLADIDEKAARRNATLVEAEARPDARVLALETDVTERSSVQRLADAAFDVFDEVHVLCNNAGVSTFEPLDHLRDEDWAWVLAVNLYGVVHGLQAFLPRMKAQPGDAHVVNTASIAGLMALPGLGPYTASKYAVVGISETLRAERPLHGIGASVLCPGFVDTQIANSERNRPARFGSPAKSDVSGVNAALAGGMDPLEVGRRVRQAVLDDTFWILTHPDSRGGTEARLQDILAAYERA